MTLAPAAGGTTSFSATDDFDQTPSGAGVYSPLLATAYEKEGITTKTFTATFDGQARPVALHEHLPSANLTVDYHVTITGYSATKVVAPI